MNAQGASQVRGGWRDRVFQAVVLLTLGFAGVFGLIVLQPDLVTALVGQETAGHISQHFRDPHHGIHDLTFAFLIGTAVVGLLAQVRVPRRNVAGQLMALTPFVGLVLALALTNAAVLSVPWVVLGAFTLAATLVHPSGRDLIRSLGLSRVDRVLLALVGIAVVPLLALALTSIGLQRAGGSAHAALGHYGFSAAFSFTVIGMGLLTSVRPAGWRLTAWVGGLLPVLFGASSLVFSGFDSSLDLVWAIAASAWGIGFIAVAERPQPQSAHAPEAAGSSSPDLGGSTATLGWAHALGAAVLLGTVLFVVMHLTGGGFGGHTPPAGGH